MRVDDAMIRPLGSNALLQNNPTKLAVNPQNEPQPQQQQQQQQQQQPSLQNKQPILTTSLSQPVLAGDNRLQVASQTGCAIGMVVQIGSLGSVPSLEVRQIVGFGSLVLDSPLVNSYSAGTTILVYNADNAPPLTAPGLTGGVTGPVKDLENDPSISDNPVPLEEGAIVEANYRQKGKYYPGKIVRDRHDGTYDIDYDDGEKETHVDRQHVRMKAQEKGEIERIVVEQPAARGHTAHDLHPAG